MHIYARDGDISPGCHQKSSKATLNHGATPFQLTFIVFICYLLMYITLHEKEKLFSAHMSHLNNKIAYSNTIPKYSL